jgi:hypothetical protein
MVTLVVGHRGAGKTAYLRGLNTPAVDLDRELEARTGRTVAELLAAGEWEFRALENQVLAQLVAEAKGPLTIAVGAGFEGPPPKNVHVLWLRRATDSTGRCFLNRPRLDPDLSPWDEYRERFFTRDRRFRDWAGEELILPEGYEGGLEGDWHLPWDLTLLPENFRAWERFIAKRLSWGIRRFEIRDDLLSDEQVQLALRTLPAGRIVYAARTASNPCARIRERYPGAFIDWALELGEPPENVPYVSLHERGDDFPSSWRA